MNEAEYERLVDARVQRRLSADSRYMNAENAEEQAQAEEAITAEVEAEIQHAAWKRQVLDAARL
jgi:hypothetical protein